MNKWLAVVICTILFVFHHARSETVTPSDVNSVAASEADQLALAQDDIATDDAAVLKQMASLSEPSDDSKTISKIDLKPDPIVVEKTALSIVPQKQSANAVDSLKESEIPVLTSVVAHKDSKSAGGTRVLISLVVVLLAGVGLIYFSKWYSKNYKKNTETHRIKVLTQHYLGPKKSLAIIRVAGESILIGVTDQNISLIKSLSYIDDEIPETTSASFKNSMIAAESHTAQPEDDFVMGNIKDKISDKIKKMRTF